MADLDLSREVALGHLNAAAATAQERNSYESRAILRGSIAIAAAIIYLADALRTKVKVEASLSEGLTD